MTFDHKAQSDLVRLIGTNAEIMRSICVFNENPADYLDESRRPEFFPAALPTQIWECKRSRRHLSRHILERIGEPACLAANSPQWPLALLQRPRLHGVARHVAAALVGSRVRRCVSRSEVLRWRDWLSPEAHDFALTRAGLLPFTASADCDLEQTAAHELGLAWIASATSSWPEPIARRFMLKLPADIGANKDAVDGAFAWRVVSSVLSIAEPRWCSSFATTRI
jgi:hypothetical protein